VANDSASGGASYLALLDLDANTTPLRVDAGARTDSLRVSSTGNVGIGTATPVLDIHPNTSDTPGIRLEQNNSGGFTAQTWDIGANESNFFVRDATNLSTLPFRIRPGALTNTLVINPNGRVGINAFGPLTTLHVSSGSSSFAGIGQILITDIVDTNRQLRFGYDSNIESGWIQASKVATGYRPLLLNPNAGNVGIGTSAPTDTLSVNGTASKPGGGTWSVFSDERLKNVKGRYTTGLRALMKLQPIRYEYKQNNAVGIRMEGEQIGFGAQEVKKVIPEAVVENANGYLMVNSDPIIWTMLNAIKEQQKEINELKKQIRQLRSARRRR
jgi:hypothetical protein